MEEADKLRLRKNFRYLVENMRVSDIRDYLYGESVLSDDDMETLSLPTTTERDKTRRLIQILPKKGPQAFSIFLQALEECNHSHVAGQLKATDPGDSTNVDTHDELDAFIKGEEKVAQLQHQLHVQVELILQFKKDVDHLRQRLESSEAATAEMRETYLKRGLTGPDVIAYLNAYMKSGIDYSDSKTELAPSLQSTYTPPIMKNRYADETTRIAYELAGDITSYMALGIPVKASNKYTDTMRKVVEELTKTHGVKIQGFITKIDIDEINGFQTISNVADEIFRVGENNWGRIVALYAFVGFVARHAVETNIKNLADVIGDYLGFYVSTKMKVWIEENNGWDGFVEYFPQDGSQPADSSRWASKLLLTAVGLGAIVGFMTVKTSS